MRKTTFSICENKDADQLRGNRESGQRLCFRYTDSTIPLLPKSKISKPLAIFCSCTARFMLDLVGNPEDWFSHNEALLEMPSKGASRMANSADPDQIAPLILVYWFCLWLYHFNNNAFVNFS